MARLKNFIWLIEAELQSGVTRQDWAENLIKQLPKDHEGRKSWLMNFGVSEEAVELRLSYCRGPLEWDAKTESATPYREDKGVVAGAFRYCRKCGSGLDRPIPEEDLFTGQECVCGEYQQKHLTTDEWVVSIYEEMMEMQDTINALRDDVKSLNDQFGMIGESE